MESQSACLLDNFEQYFDTCLLNEQNDLESF